MSSSRLLKAKDSKKTKRNTSK